MKLFGITLVINSESTDSDKVVKNGVVVRNEVKTSRFKKLFVWPPRK